MIMQIPGLAARQRWFLSAEGQRFTAPTHTADGVRFLPDPVRSEGLPSADAYADDRRKITQTILNACIASGVIDPANQPIRRAVDLGAGLGGPTFALRETLETFGVFGYTPHLEAVERHDPSRAEIIEAGILPREQVYARDAVAFLEEHPESFDFASAFMLGPDEDGDLARRLFPAAQRALTATGMMLVTSDVKTISSAQAVCDELALPYNELGDVVRTSGLTVPYMQDVLVITKATA